MKVLILSLAALLTLPVLAGPVSPDQTGRPVAVPTERTVRGVSDPAITSDGETFFAVWRDEFQDVSGAMIDAQGNFGETFPVVATWQGDSSPAIVWNGSEYVAAVSAGALGIFPVRISSGGDVRGSSAPISDFPTTAPTFAWNGSTYAYSVLEAGHSLTIYFLDASLAVTRSVPLGPASGVHHAELATDGSRFLVAWTEVSGDQVSIRVQAFDSSGDAASAPHTVETAVLDRHATRPRYSGELQPTLAWNGSAYFVVWGAGGIKGVLVGRDGVPGREFQIPSGAPTLSVSVGWDGYAHLVTWTEQTDVVGPDGTLSRHAAAALVTSTGEHLEDLPMEGVSAGWRAAIASNGDVFLVFWGNRRLVVDSTGAPRVRAEALTTQSFRNQRDPRLAVGETNALAVWQEDGGLYAGRLSKSGEPLDGGGWLIDAAESTWSIREVRVVAAGGTYLVAWIREDALRAVRITETGQILDAEPIVVLEPAVTQFVIAPDAGGFRVVAVKWLTWPNVEISGYRRALVTTWMSADGVVETTTPDAILPAQLDQTVHSLFWNGDDGYTLLWTQTLTNYCRYCPPQQFEFRASVLDRGGEPIATTAPGTPTPADALRASDGTIVLAWWSEGLRIQRFSAEGEAIGAPVILPIVGSAVSLTETPPGFVAIYSVATKPYPEFAPEIRSMRLDRDFVPTRSESVLIAADDRPGLSEVAADGRSLWILYTAPWITRPDIAHRAYSRAYFRLLRPRGRAVSH